MLSVEQLSLSFRGVRALRAVAFTAAADKVTALIGLDGAGGSIPRPATTLQPVRRR